MSFWNSVKKKASSAFSAASPYAKYAAPVILPSLAVSPFIYQALKAKQQANQLKRQSALQNTAALSTALTPKSQGPADGGEDLIDDESGWGDEWEAGMLAGGLEEDAARRVARSRRSVNGNVSGMSGIPAEVYRAGVWQRAVKLSGGRRPDAKALMVAQTSVNRDLGRRGVGIVIPGARPGRVTR